MKKLLAILLVLCVMIPLAGCSEKTEKLDPGQVKLDSANYNNLYNHLFFRTDGKTVLYTSEYWYNTQLFAYQNQVSTKLFESADFSDEFFQGSFWGIDQSIYFRTMSNEGEERHIYRYDLPSQTHTKLLTAKQLRDWMVVGEYIAYEVNAGDEYSIYDRYEHYDLYVYSMESQESALVCEDVWCFGIVGGRLRYLYATETNELGYFEYDFDTQESTLLYSIRGSQHTRNTFFNFTENYLIGFSLYEESAEFTVYSADGSDNVYTLPRAIQQFVAGDQFAYAVCYNTKESDYSMIKHEDNDIYRIDLSDGTYEALDYSVNRGTSIYTVSDDLLYILQIKQRFIGQSYTYVYRYEHSTDTTTTLFRYQ